MHHRENALDVIVTNRLRRIQRCFEHVGISIEQRNSAFQETLDLLNEKRRKFGRISTLHEVGVSVCKQVVTKSVERLDVRVIVKRATSDVLIQLVKIWLGRLFGDPLCKRIIWASLCHFVFTEQVKVLTNGGQQ